MKLVSQCYISTNSVEEYVYMYDSNVLCDGDVCSLVVYFRADFECCGGMLRGYSCDVCGSFADCSCFTLKPNPDYLYDISDEPFLVAAKICSCFVAVLKPTFSRLWWGAKLLRRSIYEKSIKKRL